MNNNNQPDIEFDQEAYLQEQARRFLSVKLLLMSENGQILMELLENECNPTKLIGADPQITAYNVGKRDVYTYLEEIMNKPEEQLTPPKKPE